MTQLVLLTLPCVAWAMASCVLSPLVIFAHLSIPVQHCVHMLTLALVAQILIGSVSSFYDYTPETFPDSIEQPLACGMTQASFLCDPSSVLSKGNLTANRKLSFLFIAYVSFPYSPICIEYRTIQCLYCYILKYNTL
ncbi:hypothetical protein Y032_0145g2487 [Ancylostoma ceylanicum]|uniref:Uncharacterized protein n=1 Tax=Ancylostoma ceylanicum TaxID=53326 RepID=A0A016T2H0_9BILA|nr:hypothetical protein Y032_0145g2487 [Ancylostoma ceylanicum]